MAVAAIAVGGGLVAAGVVTIPSAISKYFSGSDSGVSKRFLTDIAARKTFRLTVRERGTVDSLKSATVISEVDGSNTIITIVPEGTKVEEGDLLVELDSAAMVEEEKEGIIKVTNAEAALKKAQEGLEIQRRQNESDIAAAKLAVTLARLDLEKWRKGDFIQQQGVINGKIQLAEEELKRAKEVLEYSRRLARKGYKSQNELEADAIAVTKAQVNLDAAQAELDVLVNYTDPRTVEELRELADESVRALDRAERQASAAIAQFEADLKAAELTYEVETQDLAKDRAQLAACKIYAPQAGEVVYATGDDRRSDSQQIAEGTQVRERQEIIKLPDLTQMKVDLRIHESLISRVQPGLPARVRVDALPGKVFTGKVLSVSAVPVSGSWYRPDLKEYSGVVSIDYAPGEDIRLKPGLTADVEIIVQSRADVLQIPFQSVVSVGQQRFAYVLMPQGSQRREVLTGAANDTHIEILDGVDEGEKVILNPRTHFAEELAALEGPLGADGDDEEKESESGTASETSSGVSAQGSAPPKAAAGPGGNAGGGEGRAGGGQRPDPAQVFARLDKNGDGALTKDEVQGPMASNFEAADKNGDGKLDQAEATEAFKAMRGQGGGGGEGRGDRSGGGPSRD